MLGIAKYQRLTDDLLELLRRSSLCTSYRKALKIGGSVCALSTGCDMGRKFCALYPGQALWQLDWWHLFNHVHKGCKFEKSLEKEVCGLISVEMTEKVGPAISVTRL